MNKRPLKNSIHFKHILCLALIVLGIFLIYGLGLKTSMFYLRILYLPVLIVVYSFGIPAGLMLEALFLNALRPFLSSYGYLLKNSYQGLIEFAFCILLGSFVYGFLCLCQKWKRKQQRKKYFRKQMYQSSRLLKKSLCQLVKENENFSIVIFKIFNLDSINLYDSYEMGDKAIAHLSDHLVRCFGKSNLYMIHTNEAAVIIRNCSIKEACKQSKQILDVYKKPISISGFFVRLVLKCGVTNYPAHGNSVHDLSTQMGRTLASREYLDGICIYKNDMAQKNKEKYQTVVSLYKAIRDNEFKIVYQPKISLVSNQVIGIEALLRWNHGVYGQMGPQAFIEIAEDAGIISEITKWVIQNVTSQLKEWQEAGLTIKVAINISPFDLKDPSIMEYTKSCIQTKQVESASLEFELTERSIIENENHAQKLLADIKKYGLKISLDDFGTGYNSLLHLLQLPIDYIKIDKFFMDNIEDVHRPLVKSIIHMAHNMGKEVIAEGVETEKQLCLLKDMGCDNIQGYYFSRPLSADKIKDYICNFNHV